MSEHTAEVTVQQWTIRGLYEVRSVAISPDGQYIVSGGSDRLIRVARLDDDTGVRVIEGHTDDVMSVAVSPDGEYIISGSIDRTVRVARLDDRCV